MISLMAQSLILTGALIHVASLFTTRRLIAKLSPGFVRTQWCALFGLIGIFLVGYLGYAWYFRGNHAHLHDLIVPVVFFLGACFVWLTVNLSLQTAVDVMRINHLEQENIVDPLTGVYNRRFMERRLNEEITRALRYELPLSVLLIDIDHFKLINDSHGHQTGDQVLASFTSLIKSQLRETDFLARYGGEEFMVFTTLTPRQSVINLAERLRARVESHSFKLPGPQGGTLEIRLTCSIGLANLDDRLHSFEKLIHSADENLYRAKREGRNRIIAGKSDNICIDIPS